MAEAKDIEKARDLLYEELVRLRERGLSYNLPKEPPLPELMKIADAAHPAARDKVERLKLTMRKAAQRLGGGDYSKALEVLWGVDDDAFGKPLRDRRNAALPLLGVFSEEAYNRSHRKPTAEAFTAQLRALYDEVTSPEVVQRKPPWFDKTRLPQRRRFMILGAVLLLLIAVYFVRSLALWGGSATPPPGTIVNATTGKIVKKVVNRTTPQDVQVTGDIRACDLTTTSPCGYNKDGTPLRVHIGDTVEFSTLLFDPGNQQVPYLEMYLANDSSLHDTGIASFGEAVRMSIHWPTRYGKHREEPAEPPVMEVIYPSNAKGTDLTYIPGSTVLFDQKGRLLAHLPDGIMEAGIALTDVGAPASCSYCENEYARYVNFKVTVTNNGHA